MHGQGPLISDTTIDTHYRSRNDLHILISHHPPVPIDLRIHSSEAYRPMDAYRTTRYLIDVSREISLVRVMDALALC